MLFPIYDLEMAGAGILRRRSWAETTYPQSLLDSIARNFGEPLAPEAAVARILSDVRDRGDAALSEWSQRLDGAIVPALLAPASARKAALDRLDPALRAALECSAGRIAAFHRRQPCHSWLHVDEHEGTLGQLVRPLASVGVYVPGGTAPLPSSLLMAAVVAPRSRGRDRHCLLAAESYHWPDPRRHFGGG